MVPSVSDLRQSGTEKSNRFQRFRLGSLLGLMAVEIILIVSLRQRGWIATTESTRWILTVIAAVLPLAFAVMLLITSGRRMKLRTLFLFVGTICVFLSVSLTPLISVRRSRISARELTELGVELRPFSYGDYYGDSPEVQTDPTNVKFSPPDDIPSWLRPLSRKWESIPRDNEVAWVFLRDDVQVDAFVRRVSNLRNVRCIELTGNVTDDGIRKLVASHEQLPNLNALNIAATATTPNGIRELNKFQSVRSLLFNIVAVPQEGWFDSFAELRGLSVWDENQIANPNDVTCVLSQQNIDAIGNLPKLVDLHIRGIDMKGINLLSILKADQLLNCHIGDCRNIQQSQIRKLRSKSPNVRLWLNGVPPGIVASPDFNIPAK